MLKKIKGLFFSIVQLIAVIIIGCLSGNLFCIMTVYFSFFTFRKLWASQFHSYHCTCFTIGVYFSVGIILPKDNSSLLYAVLVAYFITWLSHTYVDRKDLKRINEKLLNKKKSFSKMKRREKLLYIFKNNNSEEYIEKYLIDNGIPNVGEIKLSEILYLYINNTQFETASILGLNETTITRRINNFLKGYEI